MEKKRGFDIIKGEHGLCNRCEHRVRWLETHSRRPRCECGDLTSKYSCYMYEPVHPLVIVQDKGEVRPLFTGWILSGRGHAVGLPLTERRCMVVGKKMVVYHVPVTKKYLDSTTEKQERNYRKFLEGRRRKWKQKS